MQDRVRVRRERPSVVSWMLALMVTMLAVYLITLGASKPEEPAKAASGEARVTQEATLDGVEIHLTDLGVYPTAGEARIAAAVYARRGAAGCIRETENGWRVVGAVYEVRADAERIAARMRAQEGLAASVTECTAPPVRMRITAGERDAERILSADSTLRIALARTAEMAHRIDRGELASASARLLAASEASALRDCASALQAVPGAEQNPVSRGLAEQSVRLAGMLDTVARSSMSGAMLSGQFRLCHTEGLLSLAEFLNGR